MTTRSPRRYLAFDIETAKIVEDGSVTDVLAARPLGISCAAAMASDGHNTPILWHGRTETGTPSPQMTQAEAAAMVRQLAQMADDGYTIVTWNGLAFDFNVLAEESGLPDVCETLALRHVDMMFHAVCVLGHYLGLEKTAQGMGLGAKAGMKGNEAPLEWSKGNFQPVLDYCAQDVRLTLQIAEACDAAGHLRWKAGSGAIRQMPLPHGWLDVARAQQLPLPDTSWMSDPPTREQFTRWIQISSR